MKRSGLVIALVLVSAASGAAHASSEETVTIIDEAEGRDQSSAMFYKYLTDYSKKYELCSSEREDYEVWRDEAGNTRQRKIATLKIEPNKIRESADQLQRNQQIHVQFCKTKGTQALVYGIALTRIYLDGSDDWTAAVVRMSTPVQRKAR